MISKKIAQLKKESDKNKETIKKLKNKVSKKQLQITLSKFE
tara:strand:+ start:106 stop:228 length:123 start_codon:yes stop_codon:yes gene_type:complete